MRFTNLDRFVEKQPIVEVMASGVAYDLHSDGVLQGFSYRFEERCLQVGWTLHEAAWRIPHLSEPRDRKPVVDLVLQFADVSHFRCEGTISSGDREQVLDFLEYSRVAAGSGEVRFVFDSQLELIVRGSECTLFHMRMMEGNTEPRLRNT
jgi:hypothetical protein